jgi:hypothetical protein
MAAPQHRIADLIRGPGELSFEARLDGFDPQRLWIRTATEVEPGPDAVLPACALPAMRSGGTLTLEQPVCPRMLRGQREYQGVQRAWSFGWEDIKTPLEEVEVIAPTRAPATRQATGRVAAFFSGGVDSWATVLGNREITDLIFVRGVDLLPRFTHQAGLADATEAKLREAAGELGLTFHVAETNLRDFSDPIVPWDYYSACPLVAIALFFEPLFDRVLIAGDTDYETQRPYGSGRLVDQLWSTEMLEIVDAEGRTSREERLERVAKHPLVQRTLRVCWENPEGAYNCGRCRKCMVTKISLEAFGLREAVETFDSELDLGLLDDYEVAAPIALVFWEDVLGTVREHGREDLERAVEPVVARGRRNLDLPTWHRYRHGRLDFEPPSGAELERAWREREEIEALLASRSWRLTAPLRRLGAWARARIGTSRIRF